MKDIKNICFSKSHIGSILAVLILSVIVYLMAPASMPEAAKRVLMIFIIAALFWGLELVPLYATSLLVILCEVFFLARPGGILGMDRTGYEIFLLPLGSHIIVLFFGGFILATALHKYGIDKIIAVRLIKLFGNRPYSLMFGFMFTTAFLSMWMSDTATTAMMVPMALPLLKQMEKSDPFRTGLILCIPFAALVGGMATPVGTPPNAIAIGILADHGIHINFVSWMKMAVPLSFVLLMVIGLVLYIMFPARKNHLLLDITANETINVRTAGVIAIAFMTVLLWLSSGIHKIPSAVVALLAAGLFSLTGLLDKEDFKKINWDILILMWGGLALGKGMEISGLTHWIIELPLFGQQGFVLVVVFCVLATVLSTFMSNTATANLLIPIVMVIPGESSIMLATTIALSCSLAMALPVSTPPNAIAFSTQMLKSKDMLKAGALISVVSLILIISGFKFVITSALGLE